MHKGDSVRVLVTGANGFVGRHLVRLLSKQEEIELFAGVHHRDVWADEIEQKFGVNVIPFDLGNKDSIRELVKSAQPDQTYHLAGISKTFGVSTEDYFQINSLGTYHLGEFLLKELGVHSRLLFISSAGVYGSKGQQILTETDPVKPSSEYGASKASAEAFLWSLHAKGLDVVIARPFNHTGAGQARGFVCSDLVYRLKASIANTRVDEIPHLEVGKLHSVRDFTDVRDVVTAYQMIMGNFESGSIVNVSSGHGVSVKEIVDMLVHDIACLSDVHLMTLQDQLSRVDDDIIIGNSSLLRQMGWEPKFSMMDSLRELWEI